MRIFEEQIHKALQEDNHPRVDIADQVMASLSHTPPTRRVPLRTLAVAALLVILVTTLGFATGLIRFMNNGDVLLESETSDKTWWIVQAATKDDRSLSRDQARDRIRDFGFQQDIPAGHALLTYLKYDADAPGANSAIGFDTTYTLGQLDLALKEDHTPPYLEELVEALHEQYPIQELTYRKGTDNVATEKAIMEWEATASMGDIHHLFIPLTDQVKAIEIEMKRPQPLDTPQTGHPMLHSFTLTIKENSGASQYNYTHKDYTILQLANHQGLVETTEEGYAIGSVVLEDQLVRIFYNHTQLTFEDMLDLMLLVEGHISDTK